jgi:hypothetical protein
LLALNQLLLGPPNPQQQKLHQMLLGGGGGKLQLKWGWSDEERWRLKKLALFTSSQEGVSQCLATHLLNVVVQATDGKAGVIVILPDPLRILLAKSQ